MGPSFIIVAVLVATGAGIYSAVKAYRKRGAERGPLLFGRQQWKDRLELWAAREQVSLSDREGAWTASTGTRRVTASDPHVALHRLRGSTSPADDDVVARINAYKELGGMQ